MRAGDAAAAVAAARRSTGDAAGADDTLADDVPRFARAAAGDSAAAGGGGAVSSGGACWIPSAAMPGLEVQQSEVGWTFRLALPRGVAAEDVAAELANGRRLVVRATSAARSRGGVNGGTALRSSTLFKASWVLPEGADVEGARAEWKARSWGPLAPPHAAPWHGAQAPQAPPPAEPVEGRSHPTHALCRMERC